MKNLVLSFIMFAAILLFNGCGTAGKKIDTTQIDKVIHGQTTENEILEMFGEPYKKGIQNSKEVWVYEYNKYRVIGKGNSENLIFVFDNNGVVTSHQFMADLEKK